MTPITQDASTQTKSFDELIKEHMQEKLPKDIFELPAEAYDPVTYEEIKTPLVTNCGHIFEKSTLYNLAVKTLKKDKTMNCPVCRHKIKYNTFYYPRALHQLSEKLKHKLDTVRNRINGTKQSVFP